jgi:hypothetical protein
VLASDDTSGGADAEAVKQPRGTRRFKGVSWRADTKKWRASWRNPDTGKSVHVGCFATEKAAALYYDAMVRERGGKVVNFPDESMGETQAHAGEQPQRPISASGFRGVYVKGDRFQATIRVDGRETYLGAFTTAEDAARAYDCHARVAGWTVARLNFPHETNVQAPAPLQLDVARAPIGLSGFRGVTSLNGKHVAFIWTGRRQRRLGAFGTAEDAARAYDAAARKAGKPIKTHNFPHETNAQAPVPLKLGPPGGVRPVGASGFRGVRLLNSKHYYATVCAGGRQRHLGTFKTAEAAARAYNAAAHKLGRQVNALNNPAADAAVGIASTNAPDDAAAQQQSRKRMLKRTAAGADDAAAVTAKRTQLAARLAALERALRDAKAAEAGSAARASTLQAELAASQAHVTELRACGDALHAENETKRAHAERTEAETAAAVQALERETHCRVCLNARRDATLFFACSHPLCADCGVQLAQCPSCPERRKRDPPLRIF